MDDLIEEESKSSAPIFVEEDRTFFCSELIAKAFKVLGVIEDDEKSCAKYFPSSFSSKSMSLKVKMGLKI
jgi:hypothetical protein